MADNLHQRHLISLVVITAFTVGSYFLLTAYSPHAFSLLYFLGPMLLAHYTPLLVLSGRRTTHPINAYLPHWLDCGRERTLEGAGVIMVGGGLLYLVLWQTQSSVLAQAIAAQAGAAGLFAMVAAVLVFSILADIASHVLLRRFKPLQFLRHVDTVLAGTLTLWLMVALTGTELTRSAGDYLLVAVYYGVFHLGLDWLYWNRRFGIKAARQEAAREPSAAE